MNKIKGIIPAMVTPFDEKENLDEQRTRAIVRFLKEEKVDGLYLTGSTGESFVMTPDERKALVEIVAEEAGGELPFIVHVGAIGTKVTIDLARHAEACGATAVSSVPPFYWKFSEKSIVRYYEELADAVRIPTLMYNIALAGIMNYSTIRRISQIPNIKGIKYTAQTQFEMMRMREEFGEDFIIYSGTDEMAMSGLSFGADGMIGTFFNVLPDLFQALYQASLKKDLAAMQEMQSLANAVIFTTLEQDMIPTVKRMMSWIGVDAGYARSPFTRYSAEEEAAIRATYLKLKELPGADQVRFLREI